MAEGNGRRQLHRKVLLGLKELEKWSFPLHLLGRSHNGVENAKRFLCLI
jgi:hypothetical protein